MHSSWDADAAPSKASSELKAAERASEQARLVAAASSASKAAARSLVLSKANLADAVVAAATSNTREEGASSIDRPLALAPPAT
mmetsp:Transcript_22131/g.73438  ORF Transcript_22131/g.73438 Transcript_22131/m.73438 type:complete len:84 (-) Transcript_22131:260-511(-)